MDNLISRRLFVGSTALAATKTLYPECLRAAERPLETLSFVVVTDTHIGYRERDSAAKQWRQTAESIAIQNADFVVHLGDLVDKRQESQYPIYFRAILQ